jgi:glycine/D-amino acid oxidase-like deaminating enzyme
MTEHYDYTVIGAGIYGMYLAKLLAEKGKTVLILECEKKPFLRASYVNQARVHNGYHYPRSYSTAIKSARYFKEFCNDFHFAINDRFLKIYAISRKYSLTSSEQFKKFCRHANIPCDEINPEKYFNSNLIESAFETCEYSFDAEKICTCLQDFLQNNDLVTSIFEEKINHVEKNGTEYHLTLSNGSGIRTDNVMNCTYASINQINHLFGFEKFRIKYEIAEITRCNVTPDIRNVGITVMDGPFFSVMPFGDTGVHTLTAVTFTPHMTSYEIMPTFPCQSTNRNCTPTDLKNCNTCCARPKTSWSYMYKLAKKYLQPTTEIAYIDSLYAIKPILLASEIDDSRPTMIRKYSESPGYYAILSGKINTLYDMKELVP